MPEDIFLTTNILLMILAVSVMGVSKGGFGAAGGVVAGPLMVLAAGPAAGIGIFLPVLLTMDVGGLYKYWGKWPKEALRPLFLAIVLGVVLGSVLFGILNITLLRLLVVGLIIGFFIFLALKPWLQKTASSRKEASGIHAWLWGVLAGISSFLIHAGAPPVQIYLYIRQFGRTEFHALTIVLMAFTNFAKLPLYLGMSLVTFDTLYVSAFLIPIALAAFVFGVWLHKRVSDRFFSSVILLALALTGMKFLYDSVQDIFF